MRNRGGRVLDDGRRAGSRGLLRGLDQARADAAIIGTNKKDAAETVEPLLEDARAGALPRRDDVERGARRRRSSPSAASTSSAYSGWEAIDAIERARGERAGPPARQALRAGTSSSPRAERTTAEAARPCARKRAGRLDAGRNDRRRASSGAPRPARRSTNFPISGEPIPTQVARWLGAHQGRRGARERRARAARPGARRADRRRRPTAWPRASSTTSSRSTSSRRARARPRT